MFNKNYKNRKKYKKKELGKLLMVGWAKTFNWLKYIGPTRGWA